MYFETSGSFSIFRAVRAPAGLSIVPRDHPGLHPQPRLGSCASCGTSVERARHLQRCPVCQAEAWGDAVLAEPPPQS
jgi:hypothetical protein